LGLTHHLLEAPDGVRIHAVSTGEADGRPIVLVHGFSASWQAWSHQLADERLTARHRLVALDLRGHGGSQGATGALDERGRPLPPLAEEDVLDETFEGGSRLWANDVDAVVGGLGLAEALLVGWSYGGVVVQGTIHARGLGPGERALLLSTTPVLLLPGMPGSEDGALPRDDGMSAFMRVTPDNDERTVVQGLTDFVDLCFADGTERAPLPPDELLGIVGFSLATPSSVRLAMLRRVFDYRPVLAALPAEERARITAVTPQGDRLFHAEVQNRLWADAGIANLEVPLEGHGYMWRNPAAFGDLLVDEHTFGR
jgi:pimeloyl-ACP methyl ester carboxylesterase